MIRHVWVIVSVAAGCNGWPRFDHLPDEDFVDVAAPVLLEQVADEANEGDRPDLPADLALDGRLEGLFTGLRWSGQLAWEPARPAGSEDFDCPIEPIPLTYPSDVDFFRFNHPGGSVCVTLATPLEGNPQPGGDFADFDCPDGIDVPLWEAPLYSAADDAECPTGNWLNAADDQLPRAIGLKGPGLFFANLPAGDYIGFLAAVCGRFEGAQPCNALFADDPDAECVPYDLAVALVPSQEACDALHDQLREDQ
ncbi:MAG: hypothetical protein AAGA48_20200 [Myxococcota bacterium]